MVVKLISDFMASNIRFESRVILDGSQTNPKSGADVSVFESRVILDGSQTLCHNH